MAASFSNEIPSIKVESGARNGLGTHIKPDPENGGFSPAPHSEEDIYEDAGDVDFTGSEQIVFLSRLPKFLWECWSKLDDDQEISIGRVRIEGQPGGDIKRMSLMLDPRLDQNKDVPKEYNMHIANKESHNTFIFSEKDMPGYRQFSAERTPIHYLARKNVENNNNNKIKKKSQTNARRAIPKQTSIRGQVRTEVHCQPVENDEYNYITTKQAELSFRPKQKIQLLEDTPGGNLLAPGTIGLAKDYRNFVNKNTPARKKGQLLKAARMPLNELMDLLFELFKEYTYWPFSAIKERVQQPDAYLKEVLERIAFIERTGSHMSQWQLKNEVKAEQYGTLQVKEEVAPDPGPISSFDGADDVEMDDDNMKMEDSAMG